jgi:hypothetical protein
MNWDMIWLAVFVAAIVGSVYSTFMRVHNKRIDYVLDLGSDKVPKQILVGLTDNITGLWFILAVLVVIAIELGCIFIFGVSIRR